LCLRFRRVKENKILFILFSQKTVSLANFVWKMEFASVASFIRLLAKWL